MRSTRTGLALLAAPVSAGVRTQNKIPTRHSQERLGMDHSSNEVSSPVAAQFAFPLRATFSRGDRVRKKSGAAWQGQVVGWYCTKLTPEGYAVESESHPGSVQIYPVAALEHVA
jgi:dihydrofolate reductase (trimethoprim resistance protein)